MQGSTTNSTHDLPGVEPDIKDSCSQASIEFAKATPVSVVSSTSKEDFVTFLWKHLNSYTTDWKTAKTTEDVRICHQAILDVKNQLEDLGWAKTGGGYQILEGECWFRFKDCNIDNIIHRS
jgi:hypothetical protein